MSTAVIYKSKYGATKQYAEWIAGELRCSLYEHPKVMPQMLLQYDTVIYGGGLYADMIAGIKLVTKNPCKQLVVFTVGLNNPATANFSEAIKQNIPQNILSNTKLFHLHGSLDYNDLGFFHKLGLKFMWSVLKKKPSDKLTEDEKVLLGAYGGKIDFTDKAAIEPIVEYIRGLA